MKDLLNVPVMHVKPSLEIDVENGFAWMEVEGDNVFQVCISLDDNGNVTIDGNGGCDDGICGDYNSTLFNDDYDAVREYFEVFKKFAEDEIVFI